MIQFVENKDYNPFWSTRYNLILDKKYTLSEFIDDILSQDKCINCTFWLRWKDKADKGHKIEYRKKEIVTYNFYHRRFNEYVKSAYMDIQGEWNGDCYVYME